MAAAAASFVPSPSAATSGGSPMSVCADENQSSNAFKSSSGGSAVTVASLVAEGRALRNKYLEAKGQHDLLPLVGNHKVEWRAAKKAWKAWKKLHPKLSGTISRASTVELEAPGCGNGGGGSGKRHEHVSENGPSQPIVPGTASPAGVSHNPSWEMHSKGFILDKSKETQRKYLLHFKHLFQFLKDQHLWTVNPDQITSTHLKQFANLTVETHSANVARNRISCVKGFWKYLYEEEIVARNRAVAMKMPPKPPRQGKERDLTREQVLKLYQEALKRPLTAALMSCVYHGGLRRMEAVKLQASECSYGDDGYIKLRFKGKGGKIREVPLGEDGTMAIKPYLEHAKSRAGQAAGGWLFPGGKPGTHITTEALYKRIKKLAKSVGLSDVSPHWFRHAFATHAGQGGCDPKTVSEQMGHASLETTSKYMHSNKAAGASASNFLDTPKDAKINPSRPLSSIKQVAMGLSFQSTPPPPPPPPTPEPLWRKARTGDGREYWWHRETRETRWDKPE